VPHPNRDIPLGTLRSIENQARIKLRQVMIAYIARLHKDADSDFGVSFPDLPGCISAGTTLDDARAMAEEALALHLAGLMEDGEAIPDPSGLDVVMADEANRDGVAVFIPASATAARRLVKPAV
jgi:predicted RNase H-like HicB family nuclease